MTDAIRTPDQLLEGLPDFPFEPHYRSYDGLRLAHLDEGEGAPVVFFHGEPTWSYLWRKVIPPVRDAGFRCIAPDMPGFGRSDKPTDFDWYSYDPMSPRSRRCSRSSTSAARRRSSTTGAARSGSASRSNTPTGSTGS